MPRAVVAGVGFATLIVLGCDDPAAPEPAPRFVASAPLSPPVKPRWVDDAAKWVEVPAAAPCRLSAARAGVVPKRKWTSCGDGCSRASGAPGGLSASKVVRRTAAGRYVGKEGFVRTFSTFATVGGELGGLWVTTRIGDGALVAAAKVENAKDECMGSAAFTQNPGVFSMVRRAQIFLGRAALKPESSPKWVGAWVDGPKIVTTGFASSDLWGVGGRDGTIRMGDWSSTEAKVVESSAPAHSSDALGGRAVWVRPEADGRAIVRTATSSTPTTLVEGPSTVLRVALAGEVVVWLEATGPKAREGLYETAALKWGALSTEKVRPEGSIQVDATRGLLGLRANGDYAGTIGCAGDDGEPVCGVIIVQRSKKKTWRMRSRGGHYNAILAVSDHEVLLGETGSSDSPSSARHIRRLVRIATGSLDAHAVPDG